MDISSMSEINFTDSAWSVIYSVVDDPLFIDKDAELIYESLRDRLQIVPFCDYLKRYIYEKAALKGSMKEIPLEEYRRTIIDSFRENDTPRSFYPNTVRMSAQVKNWLTQKCVAREAVFLLGFGLKMSPDDVNSFLVKALREPQISPDDPFEIICWYCYKNGYTFQKYLQLWEFWNNASAGDKVPADAREQDRAILSYLIKLKAEDGFSKQGSKAFEVFDRLFDRARKVAAEYLTAEDRLKPEDHPVRVYRAEEITEADIENILCSAIPRDRHGNLTSDSVSALHAAFLSKRPSRQRLHQVKTRASAVDRFDIITLNFFIHSQKIEPERKRRYRIFVEDTNKLLLECGCGALYVANPYEAFVLMCTLSQDPLITYMDVWERSFDKEEYV